MIDGYIRPQILKAKAKLLHDCNATLVFELGKHHHPHPHPAPPMPPPTNNSNISGACQLYDQGFDHFGSKVNRQVFSGLPDAKSDAFLKVLAGEVQIPPQLQQAWTKALSSITKADAAPVIFTSIACAPDKEKAEDACRFVVMMGKHSPSTVKSDIVLVQVNAAFGINITEASQPVLQVSETTKAGGSYVTKPVVTQGPSKTDVSQLMEEYTTFFQAVAFENVISSGVGGRSRGVQRP